MRRGQLKIFSVTEDSLQTLQEYLHVLNGFLLLHYKCVFLCRNKATLANTNSKLERKINELSDQMEEEHRITTEQKDLVIQKQTHICTNL